MTYRYRFTSVIVLAMLASPICVAQQADYTLDPHARPVGDVYALATSGSSGGLNIPDGRVLPDGTVVVGFNNALDRQYYYFARADNYQFAIGLFPNVEISGRLANYPFDKSGTVGLRDLSAGFKFSFPKFFAEQPNIAVGINDLGGGAVHFRSHYLAISDSMGPLNLTIGGAQGQPVLSKIFGGASLSLGRSGLSVSVERNNQSYFGGMRFASRTISSLANSQFVVTAQRSFKARAPDGGRYVDSSLGVNLILPFGANNRSRGRPLERNADAEALWTPPIDVPRANADMRSAAPVSTAAPTESAASGVVVPIARAGQGSAELESLRTISLRLQQAGLERVRVGTFDDTLVIEFENHRYNQNEVDAVGIVLGVGAQFAPTRIQRIAALAKKANLGLYMVSVDRIAYRRFVAGADSGDARDAFQFSYHPSVPTSTRWLDDAATMHGYSRIRIDPSLLKFVGTEIGVLDYSLAANVQPIVPLWAGAELSASYLLKVAESENVAHGVLDYAQQRKGLSALMLSQASWLGDKVLNVASVGKFMYDDFALQNETTLFVPGRDDQVRLQYTHQRHSDELGRTTVNAGALSYLFSYQPLDASVEASYIRYVGMDRGPTVQLNRWIGDVQAQLFMRKSNIQTKIGFGLAFPLTPRQGMRPGLTHIEGSGSFPLRLETKLARKGECNCVTNGVVQEMPLVYSARSNLLNQGRLGLDYFLSQLQRMREAALLYTSIAP